MTDINVSTMTAMLLVAMVENEESNETKQYGYK